MSMLRQVLFFTAVFLFSGFLPLKAQDPIFSQFYSAPLQLNPAFAGNTYMPRITMNYRNQWASILPKAFVTYAVSYEQFFEEMNSGIGLMLQSDAAGNGLYKTNKFSAVYGYRLQVSDDFFIKFGVEGAVTQSSLDWDRLLFPDQIDPINGTTNPSGSPYLTEEERPENLNTTYFDVSAGALVVNRYFYAGFSVKHLNSPNESFLKINDNLNVGLPLRMSLHGGAQITLTEGNNRKMPAFISPNVMLVKQGDFGQINAGAYGGFGVVFAGAWYRHAWTMPDAAIFLVGFHQGIYKIGYSYDMTISSQLGNSRTGGTHEISLMLNFDNSEAAKRRKRASRYNDCLNMFR